MELALKEFERCRCLYCRKELDKDKVCPEWDPREHEIHQYQSIRCECGKKNWVKIDFDCSGHDSLFVKSTPLESTIKQVREK
jgi:hypothetical protein